MTLSQFFDMPLAAQSQCDEWLRLYRKWYKAQSRRKNYTGGNDLCQY